MKKEETPKTPKAAYVPPKVEKKQLLKEVLGIAPTTAKNHVKSILVKLNAKNRTQAVNIARERGLLK